MVRRMHDERGSALSIVADVLGILAALLALWEAAARLDIVSGPSPIEFVRDLGDSDRVRKRDVPRDVPTIPDPRDSDPLDAPANVSLSGGCDGSTLTWDAVPNAERYRIMRDGGFSGLATGTTFQFRPPPDGAAHEYQVIAMAFGWDDSEPSASVVSPVCTFP